jgi:hypothetical protein
MTTQVIKIKSTEVVLPDGTIASYSAAHASYAVFNGFGITKNGKLQKSANGQWEVYRTKAIATKEMNYSYSNASPQ